MDETFDLVESDCCGCSCFCSGNFCGGLPSRGVVIKCGEMGLVGDFKDLLLVLVVVVVVVDGCFKCEVEVVILVVLVLVTVVR